MDDTRGKGYDTGSSSPHAHICIKTSRHFQQFCEMLTGTHQLLLYFYNIGQKHLFTYLKIGLNISFFYYTFISFLQLELNYNSSCS